MGKPILFDTISRSKFNELSEDVKKRKNYQVKEPEGEVSKYISGLIVEGGSGLPEVSANDSGKVLTVNASGSWEAAPSQGGGTGGNVLKTVEITAVKVDDDYRYFTKKNIDTVASFLDGDNDFRFKVSFYASDDELIGERYGYVDGIICTDGLELPLFNVWGQSCKNNCTFMPAPDTYVGHYELTPLDHDMSWDWQD